MSETARARSGLVAIDRRTALVAAGDLLLLAGLLIVGVIQHGTDPLADPLATAETMAPFVLAWLPVAALAGLYAADAFASPGRAIRLVTVGWLAAANVGLILRSSPAFDGGAAWPFNLVIAGLGLVVLVVWRGAVAAVSARR
ncbi:DUF3054 domain-containing protein [Saliphagus sp. LR7]|uniref:DUF3054 domain-containing protein n=1 Tax=Saliphagus sp. LR7 TaxID=2282654 RepID=UPI000DF84C32|nr:DUF3054 domain-containing protein [Saliphagus sp. LR7]